MLAQHRHDVHKDIEAGRCATGASRHSPAQRQERMFAPITARLVLVDTEGWF
jgi:hypothetical protein